MKKLLVLLSCLASLSANSQDLDLRDFNSHDVVSLANEDWGLRSSITKALKTAWEDPFSITLSQGEHNIIIYNIVWDTESSPSKVGLKLITRSNGGAPTENYEINCIINYFYVRDYLLVSYCDKIEGFRPLDPNTILQLPNVEITGINEKINEALSRVATNVKKCNAKSVCVALD